MLMMDLLILIFLFFHQSFESITVLFCELCDFDYSTIEGAMDIVSSMNAVFSCFDSLMDKFNVYKVNN